MNKYFFRIKKNLKSFISKVDKITSLEVYIVIFVVSAVVFATRYFETQSDYRFIRVEVTTNEWIKNRNQYSYKTPSWMSQSIEVGQAERSPSGRIRAEIVDLENYERGNDQAEIYLIVKLMADYNEKSRTYSYRGQSISIGEPIEFNFDETTVPGQILDNNYPKDGYEVGDFTITLRYEDAEPWIIDQIQNEDTMKNRATGEIIAKLIEFKTEPSNTTQVSQEENGKITFENNTNLKDIVAKFKVKAHKEDGNWFFAGHQRLRVGSTIWIYLEKVTFQNAMIEDLKYVSSQID